MTFPRLCTASPPILLTVISAVEGRSYPKDWTSLKQKKEVSSSLAQGRKEWSYLSSSATLSASSTPREGGLSLPNFFRRLYAVGVYMRVLSLRLSVVSQEAFLSSLVPKVDVTFSHGLLCGVGPPYFFRPRLSCFSALLRPSLAMHLCRRKPFLSFSGRTRVSLPSHLRR